jgi:hypothetical protein
MSLIPLRIRVVFHGGSGGRARTQDSSHCHGSVGRCRGLRLMSVKDKHTDKDKRSNNGENDRPKRIIESGQKTFHHTFHRSDSFSHKPKQRPL